MTQSELDEALEAATADFLVQSIRDSYTEHASHAMQRAILIQYIGRNGRNITTMPEHRIADTVEQNCYAAGCYLYERLLERNCNAGGNGHRVAQSYAAFVCDRIFKTQTN